MTEKMRLVVIDNHVLLRSGLSSLAAAFEELTVVAEGGYERALALVEEHCPDVVLLNLICMDGHYGTTLIPELINRCPSSRILVMANLVNDRHLLQALRQGAMGCLLGDSLPMEICQAVRVLVNGGSYLPAKMSQKILQGFSQPVVFKQQNTGGLSQRQVLVLSLVSRGLTNLQISEQLQISKRTAEMHIYKIFKKLKVNNRTQAIQAAVRLGVLDIADWQPPSLEQNQTL
jgi:DNA-binding NarL/FixJ family response regulator